MEENEIQELKDKIKELEEHRDAMFEKYKKSVDNIEMLYGEIRELEEELFKSQLQKTELFKNYRGAMNACMDLGKEILEVCDDPEIRRTATIRAGKKQKGKVAQVVLVENGDEKEMWFNSLELKDNKELIEIIREMRDTIEAKDSEIKGLTLARDLFFDSYIRLWDDNFGCFQDVVRSHIQNSKDGAVKKEWGTSLLKACFPDYFRNKDVLTKDDAIKLHEDLVKMREKMESCDE